MQKKIHFFLILFLLLTGSANVFSAPQEIRLWQFWPEKWIQPELERFHAETGIKVKVERLTWADGLNKIITALAANQAPDVIEIGSTWVAGFSEGGGLQEFFPHSLSKQLIMWKPAKVGDQFFAAPWTVSTSGLFFNKSLLEKAGVLTVPNSWASLLDASKKINALGPSYIGFGLKMGAYSTWQKFLPFAWSNDAYLLHPNLHETGLNSPQFIETVQYYKELKKVGLYDDNLAIRKAFKEGKVGFMIEEPGQVELFSKEVPGLKFGVMPIPTKKTDIAGVSFAGAQMLAITKNSKNYKAADKLIRFLVRPEVTQKITHNITTLFPAYKGAEKDPFYKEQHPELLTFLDILKSSTSPVAHPKWIDIQEVFSEQLDRVMYDLDSPEVALKTADQDIIQILNEKTDAVEGVVTPYTISNNVYGGIVIALFSCVFLGVAYVVNKLRKDPLGRHKRAYLYNFNTFLFLSPWLGVFCLFSIYPIFYSLYLGFTTFKATSTALPIWVGLQNYARLLEDQHFINSVGNSILFVIGTVPVIMLISVLLAVILNQNLKFRTFYRTAFFMPVVTSIFVIATLFIELYAPTGIFNQLLSLIGAEGKHWLKDIFWALPSIMIMNIWASFGFYTLMLLAGLQNIPDEYYEASCLEGAGKIRQFFTITLPLLKPTILVAAIMDTILAFQVFGEVFIMTKGGPLRTTETAVYYIYNNGFHKQQMGYSSAAAYYVFFILMLVSGIQIYLFKKKKTTK